MQNELNKLYANKGAPFQVHPYFVVAYSLNSAVKFLHIKSKQRGQGLTPLPSSYLASNRIKKDLYDWLNVRLSVEMNSHKRLLFLCIG